LAEDTTHHAPVRNGREPDGHGSASPRLVGLSDQDVIDLVERQTLGDGHQCGLVGDAQNNSVGAGVNRRAN